MPLDTCPSVQYIYISTEEMKAVAEYIKRRGRIAIGELAAKSNTFIDLEAKATAVSLWLAPSSNRPVLHSITVMPSQQGDLCACCS